MKKLLSRRFKELFYEGFGFTLIELLIVIAIIGILVTIVIVAINPLQQIQNTQDARRRSDLQAFKQAMQLFYNDNRFYPCTSGTAGCTAANTFPTINTCWSSPTGCASTATIYMRNIPADPANNNVGYGYSATPANCDNVNNFCTNYVVGAVLARPATTADGNSLNACSSGTGIASPNWNGASGTSAATTEVCND